MENINIDEIIHKWFDMKYQTYDRLEHDGSIYLYYVGQEYAEIRIDKNDEYIYYKWEFYVEFSEIIPIRKNIFQEFMSKWVEDTFNLKGFTPSPLFGRMEKWLKMPKIDN